MTEAVLSVDNTLGSAWARGAAVLPASAGARGSIGLQELQPLSGVEEWTSKHAVGKSSA